MITREDIQQLAVLARLSVTDEQCDAYQKDFEGVLEYINTLNAVEVKQIPSSGVLKNVLREDDIAYEPKQFTEALLDAAPMQENGYVKVAKIL
mgnify:CR=1 FL=1